MALVGAARLGVPTAASATAAAPHVKPFLLPTPAGWTTLYKSCILNDPTDCVVSLSNRAENASVAVEEILNSYVGDQYGGAQWQYSDGVSSTAGQVGWWVRTNHLGTCGAGAEASGFVYTKRAAAETGLVGYEFIFRKGEVVGVISVLTNPPSKSAARSLDVRACERIPSAGEQ